MPFDKAAELLLIELRGAAPLIRTLRDFDDYPKGTLSYVTGVNGLFLKVRLVGSDEDTLLLTREVKDVE